MNYFFKGSLQTAAALVSLFLIFSCNSQQEKHASTSNFVPSDSLLLSKHATNTVRTDTANKSEVFADFFPIFSKNKNFQNSRITFPFKCYVEDVDTSYVEEIQRKDWQFTTFKLGTNGNTGNGKYTTDTVRVTKTEYEVRLKGIDNGIFVVYTFYQKGGKWFLVKMLNGST